LNEILKEELEKKLFGGDSCLQNREKLELYLENQQLKKRLVEQNRSLSDEALKAEQIKRLNALTSDLE
jgi:uncharacterized damage-inducible protein DinB